MHVVLHKHVVHEGVCTGSCIWVGLQHGFDKGNGLGGEALPRKGAHSVVQDGLFDFGLVSTIKGEPASDQFVACDTQCPYVDLRVKRGVCVCGVVVDVVVDVVVGGGDECLSSGELFSYTRCIHACVHQYTWCIVIHIDHTSHSTICFL